MRNRGSARRYPRLSQFVSKLTDRIQQRGKKKQKAVDLAPNANPNEESVAILPDARGTSGPQGEMSIQSSKPTLLGLPAEIRNKIYRYALVEQAPIDITEHSCVEAALTRTSRQLRFETQPIYSKENQFKFYVVDCKPQVPRCWTEYWLWKAHGKPGFTVVLEISGGLNWTNLLGWLKACHAGKMFSFDLPTKISRASFDTKTAARTFQILREMEGLPWARIKAVVEVVEGIVADGRGT